MLKENLRSHPKIHHKILHFKVFFSSKSGKFTKKEQNLFFKEPKEHFLDMFVCDSYQGDSNLALHSIQLL